MRTRLARACRRAAALIVGGGFGGLAPLCAQQPAAPAPAQAVARGEPLLLDVRFGQAASLAIAGERLGARAWLPVATLLEAMELQLDVRTPARVVARRWPEGTRYVLDADSGIMRAHGARTDSAQRTGIVATRGDTATLHVRDGELLVDVHALAALLGIPVELGFADLVLSFPEIAALPIGRRLARDAAHARFRAREHASGDERATGPLARPWADGAVLDYSLALPIGAAAVRPGWNTGVGLDVLGGSLEVTAGATAGGVRLPTLASWTGVWRAGTALTQLRIGDGTGAGPRPRFGRGIMLTNAPYVRPALFGLQTVRGALPPGWAIEAYRNGELVAVDTIGRDARYQLRVPLLYGENPYDLLAVGPFGQTRALSQATRVAMDLLPGGRGEYALGATRCQLRQQCRTAASADYRHGLSDRWTARAGLEGLSRDSIGWIGAPYVALSGTPWSAIGVQGEFASRSHTRLALNIEPSQRVRVAAEQQWFARDAIDPLLAGRRLVQSGLFATWRSFAPSQPNVELSLDRSRFLDGAALLRARLG
ncbi:MAG: hypothetical protein MUF21_12305, partial [Gemmatimonadaceae bacterium]|nr:hypothetical protein [Gemmatimonadaceae bacterium]